MKYYLRMITLCALLSLCLTRGYGQAEIFVNMGMLDGMDLTPDNIFHFQVQSGLKKTSHCLVTGTIKFRNSDMRISYRFEYDLQPGLNLLQESEVRPQFEYSSQALRELFADYKKLPEGIYEYCVSIKPDYSKGESSQESFDECVYHKSTDVFLINLIDPDDDAKIYEYNPVLSWTVNYPFASQLKYRIRVAEVKKGQNAIAAISRNNPVYDEKNLMQMSLTYPIYGKPLVKDQLYAWTVDAYFKGLLIGGAAPWRFTIIEDSLMVALPTEQSYYEFAEHRGETMIYALDTIKLKYRTYAATDTLTLNIVNDKEEAVKYKEPVYGLQPGMNFIDLDLPGKAGLKHLKNYTLYITTSEGKKFQVPFKYVNPLFLKK